MTSKSVGEDGCAYAPKFFRLNLEWSCRASARTKAHHRKAAPRIMVVVVNWVHCERRNNGYVLFVIILYALGDRKWAALMTADMDQLLIGLSWDTEARWLLDFSQPVLTRGPEVLL